VKVLVTGGSGFIGSHVVRHLQHLGHEPLILDHHGWKDGIDCETFLGDVRDYTAVSEAVATSDGVIHLAGVLGTQETIEDPLPAAETNIVGGLNVFQAVRRYDVPAVYIAVGNHWMQNSYSITKTTAERFALMYNQEHGTRIAIVRALNAYGPGQKAGPVKKIIPNFILPCLRDEPIVIYGDGEQVMDMIYVTDVADILCRALLLEHGQYDRAFEAGTGRALTVNQIAEMVIDTVTRGSIEHVPMRPGEPEHSTVVADTNTLQRLGLVDFATLEDGLVDTVSYYRALERSLTFAS
jgi:UDP-glucose 4-epimerase